MTLTVTVSINVKVENGEGKNLRICSISRDEKVATDLFIGKPSDFPCTESITRNFKKANSTAQ